MAVLITSHKFCAGHVLYVFQLGHAHICVAPRVSWTLLKKPAELIQVRKQIHVQPLLSYWPQEPQRFGFPKCRVM